jgi:hypothetical protein
MSASYPRAVGAADVTHESVPKEVAESAKRPSPAIQARIEAPDAWVAAKDALTVAKERQADTIAEARIGNRPARPPSRSRSSARSPKRRR